MNWIDKRFSICVVAASFLFTSCSSDESGYKAVSPIPENAVANSPTPAALTKAQESEISFDIGCEYVREGFRYEGTDLFDAEASFEVAADSFREVALENQFAMQFMNGSLAAAKEIHRWGSGRSMLQGAKDGNYIRGDEAAAIVSMYNYCVASDLSQSD
jgi:hypothetical protein